MQRMEINNPSILIEISNGCKNFDSYSLLLKLAIYYAQKGYRSWLISKEQVNNFKLIECLLQETNDVLELITFVSLENKTILLDELLSINNKHQIPRVILIDSINAYFGENHVQIASVIVALLSAVNVCKRKHKKPCFLITTCAIDLIINQIKKLYFQYLFILNSTNFDELINQIHIF